MNNSKKLEENIKGMKAAWAECANVIIPVMQQFAQACRGIVQPMMVNRRARQAFVSGNLDKAYYYVEGHHRRKEIIK